MPLSFAAIWNRLFAFSICLLVIGCNGAATGPTDPENTASGSTGGGSGKTERIVILTNGDDPFWDACEAGAKAAAEELKLSDSGYVIDFQRTGFSSEKQVEALKGYRLAGDVAGVAVSVYESSSNAIARELEDLKDAGITVVTIDNDIDRERFRDVRTAYLGTDNIIAGTELGKAAAALKPEGGKYVCFVGNKSAGNGVSRIDGFGLGAGEKFTKLEALADGGDPAKARQFVDDAIQRHEDVDTLVGIWAYNTPAIVQIVDQKERQGDFFVCSIDAAELTIRGMTEGKVDAMVVQNPFNMGYEGTKLVHALLTEDDAAFKEMFPNFGETDGDLRSTGLKIVVPDDSPLVEQKDIFEDGTEFMTLTPFKNWLKKYGLKSS